MWYRIFAPTEAEPKPTLLAERLHALGLAVVPHFKGDDLGWTRGELVLPGGQTPILLERYLTDVDEIRDDLNAFAAELETMTYSPNATGLMERVINTKQLIAIRKPIDHADDSRLDATVREAVTYIATELAGFWQADGSGWFEADGTLLVQEY
jgi:hypothetical protein